MTNTNERRSIEELSESPYWIVDILPYQVPKDGPGQYFAVEDYFLHKERFAKVKQKHIDLVLKLNCYTDISLEDEEECNPAPERIAAAMRKRAVWIRVGASAILSETDETYLTVFDPDEELLELIKTLAVGEGLYVWQPPA